MVPELRSSAGAEAVELAASAGLVLDPWQQLVLDGALGERPDGQWSAFEVGIVVPRQNGKGSILEARELAGLFLFGDRLMLHSAHEFKTAAEAFLRLLHLIENTPDLDRRVQRVRTSHGEEGIELKGGQRIRFVARSTGSGRGFTGDTVILDEAYNLTGKAMSALLPTMAARSVTGNPQLWYTSTAPLPEAVSDVLRKLIKRGRSGDSDRLAYFEWSSDSDVDLDDPESWAAANPGFGLRISEEYIRSVEREAMDDADFARERLGIFPDPDEIAAWTVISEQNWRQTEVSDLDLVDPVVLALDVAPDRSSAAICAASDTPEGVPGLDVVFHGKGTSWVVDKVAQVCERNQIRGVVVDPVGQAGAHIDELVAAGVNVMVVSTKDHKQACGQFYDDATEGTLRHLPQPELEAAVAGAEQRLLQDAWLWDRRADTDITPLVAATLALWGHRQPYEDTTMAVPEVVLL